MGAKPQVLNRLSSWTQPFLSRLQSHKVIDPTYEGKLRLEVKRTL